jgi:5'-3' exonuclease
MLALASHEPHFALLRETTDYRPPRRDKSNGAPSAPSKVDQAEKARSKGFQLLHISILRDYMELEFTALKAHLPGDGWNLERLVDDFVLLCYLVGNDFLPNLPGLDIATGGLNDLLSIYKDLVPVWGDYLTLLGQVDLGRLEQLLGRIGSMEQEMFERAHEELVQFQARSSRQAGRGGGRGGGRGAGNGGGGGDFQSYGASGNESVEEYKARYYEKKLGLSMADTEGHVSLRQRCRWLPHSSALHLLLLCFDSGHDAPT